jgi:hypothetical protein
MNITRIVAMIAALIPSTAAAYEEGYRSTEPGVVELKTIPAARIIQARAGGDYWRDGSPFRPLFRYISDHDVAMTVPVEVDVAENRMRFLVGSDAPTELPEQHGAASLLAREQRIVLAAGLRGGYSQARYDAGVQALASWLAEHPEWVAAGQPVAVFWNGPYVPGPLKRSEVQVPVERAR